MIALQYRDGPSRSSRRGRPLAGMVAAATLLLGGASACAGRGAPPAVDPAVEGPAAGGEDREQLAADALRLEAAAEDAYARAAWGEAAARYEQAIAAVRRLGDPPRLSRLLNDYAVTLTYMGLPGKALEAAQEAVSLRDEGDPDRWRPLYNRGFILWEMGDRVGAEAALRQAALAAPGIEAARIWLDLSEVLRELAAGDEMLAAVARARASNPAGEEGAEAVAARCAVQEGLALTWLDRPEDAVVALSDGLRRWEALGDAFEAGQAAFNLGLLAEQLGDEDLATASFEAALTHARSTGDAASEAAILPHLPPPTPGTAR